MPAVLYDSPILYDAVVPYDSGVIVNHPRLQVEIGFTAAPLDPLAYITWTDVSAYARGFKSKRGRQHELARVETGTASVLLNNRDRRFDPTYSGSPYSPHVLPARRIRISALWAGNTYRLFTGYIEDWALQDPNVADSDVLVGCTDAFKLFNLLDLPTSPWQIEVRKDSPKVWLRLGSDSGTVASDSSGHSLHGQYQGTPAVTHVDGLITGDPDQGMVPLHTADQRVSLPYKTLIPGFPFTAECWIKTTTNRAERKTILAGESGPTGSNTYMSLAVEDSASSPANAGRITAIVTNNGFATVWYSGQFVDDGLPHHIVWVANSASSWAIYVDGVNTSFALFTGLSTYPSELAMGYAVGNTPAVAYGDYGFDGTLDEFVLYTSALSGGRILWHTYAGFSGWAADNLNSRITHILDNVVGWPSTDRIIDTGRVSLAPNTPGGSVLGHLQVLAETEGGIIYIDGAGNVVARDRNYVLTNPTSNFPQTILGDTGGYEIPYLAPLGLALDDTDIWNRALVTRAGGVTQQVDASASQAAYGTRSLTRSGQLYASDNEAADTAHYLVDTYATPIPRVRHVTFTPASIPHSLIPGDSVWPQALGRALLDRIIVKHQPVGGGAPFSQEALIEDVEHDWMPPALWHTTWQLEAADTRTYWVLGTSALGVDDRLYY